MLKWPLKFIAGLCMAAMLCGCAGKVQTLTPKELEALKHQYQEPKVSTWYYMGTKDGYHYLAHVDLPHERLYRIAAANFDWQTTAPYTTARGKWVQLPWGVQDPHFFGATNYYRVLPRS